MFSLDLQVVVENKKLDVIISQKQQNDNCVYAITSFFLSLELFSKQEVAKRDNGIEIAICCYDR
jgi:hypothetical protein